MTITQKIQALLDQGEKVYSEAWGRFGSIVRTDGRCTSIQLESKQIGVTSFESGDKVTLIQKNGFWFVTNIFE